MRAYLSARRKRREGGRYERSLTNIYCVYVSTKAIKEKKKEKKSSSNLLLAGKRLLDTTTARVLSF